MNNQRLHRNGPIALLTKYLPACLTVVGLGMVTMPWLSYRLLVLLAVELGDIAPDQVPGLSGIFLSEPFTSRNIPLSVPIFGCVAVGIGMIFAAGIVRGTMKNTWYARSSTLKCAQ